MIGQQQRQLQHHLKKSNTVKIIVSLVTAIK